MSLAGRASAAGTARFAERAKVRTAAVGEGSSGEGGGTLASHPLDAAPAADGHFRTFAGLRISSVGFGTATGEPTDEVDARYVRAVAAAVERGCNHFDTAISYRGQRSEAALGRALAELAAKGVVQREEVIVASKAGFIPYPTTGSDTAHYIYETLIEPGIAEPGDLAGGIHCMAPNFIGQQIAWSLRNTGLRTLDIYYLQNPETQLPFVDRTAFRR